MWRLIRYVSIRQLRETWGRTLLVVAGIATGVTLIVAIRVINASILENFKQTIDMVAGPAQLEVTLGIGESSFDETVLAKVKQAQGVSDAVGFVRGTVSIADRPSRTLDLFGVDFTQETALAAYPVAEETSRRDLLRSLGESNAILLATGVANSLGVQRGDSVRLSTSSGLRSYRVAGLLKPHGIASILGDRLVVMDLPVAQSALGIGTGVHQIDVFLDDGADVNQVQERLRALLPATLLVQRPAQRGEQYERVFHAFQAMLLGLSTLCLVAGIFIVYNTTSTGAVRRALSLATMRHIGADPAVLFRLLMWESLCLGALGTALGTVQGLILARFLKRMVVESMGVIFQLRFPLSHFHVNSSELLLISLAGISATLFASYFSAKRITALDPLTVMRNDLDAVVSARPSGLMVFSWAGLVILSGLALLAQTHWQSIAWGNFGSTLWFASSIVIAIPLVSWISSGLSRVLPKWLGAEGRVASESLFRSPTRTGVTVAAIALVLTIAISSASMARSFRDSVKAYFSSGFLASDLTVSAIATNGGWLESPIPAALAGRIRRIAGVQSVDTLRILPGQLFRGERIAVAGSSPGLTDPSRHPRGWYRQGDPATAHRLILAGTGARISTTLAEHFSLKMGDTFSLDTPTGRLPLRVVGIVPDYMSDRGGVGISRKLLASRWNDNLVNRIGVDVAPTASVDEIRSKILAAIGERYRLKILTLQQLGTYHDTMITRAFAFTDAIQLLVIIVTFAGILDLLFALILERRHELALWRLIGADERTVRNSVIIESWAIGVLGATLGAVLGYVTSWIWVRVNFRYLLGYELDFHFATRLTLWYIALTVIMTVLAGSFAAGRAVKDSVLEGIRRD